MQLLDQVDSSDADVEDAHTVGKAILLQPLGDRHSEAVVSAEHVAHACHQNAHVEQDTGMDVTDELEARLRRFPAERYPVQRATTLFHLGLVLSGQDPPRAEDVLSESAQLFMRSGLEVEAAKAANALGAVLRDLGRPAEAVAAFRRAAEGLPPGSAERAAALFNLGLVTRDGALLSEAREAFAALGARREEASAARELGALLLEQGDVPGAVALLERAVERAESAGDAASLGAAANAAGLAYLAAGRGSDAIDVLRRATAAHPRSIRPEQHAMAKANLALAYERAGNSRRARLAAKQARAVPGVPTPVRRQAEETLARLGDAAGDLPSLLDEESRESWPALIREEAVRWAEADADSLRDEARAWVTAQDGSRAEALLGALLEVPPAAMQRVLDAVLAAGTEATRAELERASSLFHAPQELRVRELIARWEERRSSQAI